MNKKWMIVIISFFLMAAIIGTGGKIYMDKRTEQNEEEKIKIEKKSIEALKERYANIKSVEIIESSIDKKTGAFDINIKMTNKENESVHFTYPFWVEENEIGAILAVDRNIQVKGQTTNKVQVTYSNKEKGEV